MSAYEPPTIISTIYNPAFFEASATNTITQAQANALYLKKKTADTATALETFSAGIATNSLATTTLASNLLIGSATNTGTIYISTIATNNTNADPAISIGGNSGTKTIKINNGTNSVHCSSIDMLGSGINNVSNATGNVDIGNLQTSGDINVGANVGRLVDGIINIGTGGTVANPINIGSSTSLTSVGGTLGVTSGITTNKLNPLTTSSSLFIGDNSSSGTIAIKGTDGSTGIVAICDGPTTACTIDLGSNLCTTKIRGLQKLDTAATATCDIALSQTTGVLNIATGARLITVPGNGVINIGTGSGAVVNPINIGGASSATSIGGTLTSTGLITANGGIKATTYNGSTPTSEIYLGNDQVSGTGGISIGTGLSRSSAISIGTGNASVIGIGGSGLTTIGTGGLTVSGLLTANGGLTIGGTNNYIIPSTINTGTTDQSKIGCIVTSSGTITPGAGSGTQICTSGTLTFGVWLVIGSIYFTAPSTNTNLYTWIGDNTTAYANRLVTSSILTTSGFETVISITKASAGPFNLVAQNNAGGTSITGSIFCTRIA